MAIGIVGRSGIVGIPPFRPGCRFTPALPGGELELDRAVRDRVAPSSVAVPVTSDRGPYPQHRPPAIMAPQEDPGHDPAELGRAGSLGPGSPLPSARGRRRASRCDPAERAAEGHLRAQGSRRAFEESDLPDQRLVEPRLQAGGGRAGEGISPDRAPARTRGFQQEERLRVGPRDIAQHRAVDPAGVRARRLVGLVSVQEPGEQAQILAVRLVGLPAGHRNLESAGERLHLGHPRGRAPGGRGGAGHVLDRDAGGLGRPDDSRPLPGHHPRIGRQRHEGVVQAPRPRIDAGRCLRPPLVDPQDQHAFRHLRPARGVAPAQDAVRGHRLAGDGVGEQAVPIH
jgi:hypothetical protein